MKTLSHLNPAAAPPNHNAQTTVGLVIIPAANKASDVHHRAAIDPLMSHDFICPREKSFQVCFVSIQLLQTGVIFFPTSPVFSQPDCQPSSS